VQNFVKYFIFGALLALPLIASAQDVGPGGGNPVGACAGNYPSCCGTACSAANGSGFCVHACQNGPCYGNDLNTCESDCATYCPS
jgi:hypothetical protein